VRIRLQHDECRVRAVRWRHERRDAAGYTRRVNLAGKRLWPDARGVYVKVA
jgi:hypothetical protein